MSFSNASMFDAVLTFCEPLSNKDLVELQGYLMYDHHSRAASGIEQAFVDHIFGTKEWAKYLEELVTKPYFLASSETKSLIPHILNFVAWVVHHRFLNLVNEVH